MGDRGCGGGVLVTIISRWGALGGHVRLGTPRGLGAGRGGAT